MKNIEKYHETKSALEAYNQSKSKNMPFEVWLELEYKEPRMQTLLEAAETVVTIWKSNFLEGSLTNIWNAIANLSEVIKLEKAKPVRNFNKYKTAKDANEGFIKFCEINECDKCRYGSSRGSGCLIDWLYDEAKNEAGK